MTTIAGISPYTNNVYYPITFKSQSIPEQKVVTEVNKPEKPETKKSKKGVAFLGAALALSAVVIGGLAFKKKMDTKKAAEALAKEAEELGLQPEVLQRLKTSFGEVKKYENIAYEDIYKKLKEIHKKKNLEGGSMVLMSPKTSRVLYKTHGYDIKELPENAFTFVVQGKNEGDIIYSELIIPQKVSQGLIDVVSNAWNAGKIFVQNIE